MSKDNKRSVERGEASDDLISIDTFQQSNFNVGNLLASLTEDLIKVEKENGKGFNPDPFINRLEDTVGRLIPLRDQVNQKIQALELEVNQREKDYKYSLEDLRNGLNKSTIEFSGLDSNITEIGKTVIRVGEQLESIDKARSRASEVHDIILYYNEFARGETNRLEALRKEGKDGRSKVAVVARRLLAVSKEVEGVEGSEVTRTTIEKYAERFEKDMLRLFEKAYLKGEPKVMAHCAQTLLDFNGGQSCIQIYVNQHDFFISRERIEAVNYVSQTPMWLALADPNKSPPKTEPELENLYTDIREQISQEAQIIEAVFPQPVVVMKVFLQRLFAQVVQSHIEKLITAAQGYNTLALLRVLAIARSSTAKLINDLKAHEFFRSSSLPVQSSSINSFNPIGSGQRTNEDGDSKTINNDDGDEGGGGGGGVDSRQAGQTMAVSTLSMILDQQLDELFSNHLNNNRYLDKEVKNLSELYGGYLIKFARWHRTMNKAKSTTIFDRMVNQLSTAASQAGSVTTSSSLTGATEVKTTGGGLKSLLKPSSSSNTNVVEGDAGGKDGAEEVEVEEGDGDLNLEVVEKLLTWHAESIGRMIELSAPSDVPKNVFGLLKALAESFCKAYVEAGLETCQSQLLSQDPKMEPDLRALKVIKLVDLSMNLWQRYLNNVIMPLSSSSVTVRRELSIYNHNILVRIEDKINTIVQKALELTITWLGSCLNKQKKLDFKPKNDEIEFDRMNTEACESSCSYLDKVRVILVEEESLSGKNVENFLNEAGVVFHSMLLEHLKKFPVSAIGGLMLTKDLAMYQDTISRFEISDLNDRFEMLRELGNIFVVQPSILKSYLNESMLGKLDSKLLRPYLNMRADFGDQPKKFWDEVVGIGGGGGGGGGGEGSSSLGTGSISSSLSLDLMKQGSGGSGSATPVENRHWLSFGTSSSSQS
ncbi:exocyst complex component Sec10-like protein [Phakopsora pachyrhizi]|uniref:Exocyst complex component Sec10-like protein n=1 Tax=Phakopsora pachyrhizi TaxID=170000 RepID=A0AAV0BLJ9_PHAPC|nr:exocyst complex component Sec10-like protein [Phakopsora pachyrhizi]CAH7688197.1 exocyst complex component Sec10-like protein [Phakopsora pachyrhizi]